MTTNITGRLARVAATRPWLTLAGWAIALAAAIGSAGTIADYVTPSQVTLVTTEADRADDLHDALRVDATAARYDEQVVITSDTVVFGSPEFAAAVEAAVDVLQGVDGVADLTLPVEGATVSGNGASALIGFTVPADDALLQQTVDAIAATSTDDTTAFVYGTASVSLALNTLANDSLATGEGIGIIVALIVLVFVFGAFVAAGLPLVIAIVSIVMATGLSALVARILTAFDIHISDSVAIFAGMMGLALGIDYALLTVQRFREELAHGRSVIDAVTVTGATANRAVLISGLTVVVSIGGLLLLPLNTFLGIGVAIIMVAASAVSTALMLMPALLRLLGHRVNSLRLPGRHPGQESTAWKRLATGVANRPAVTAVAGLAVLGALTSPLLTIQFAQPSPDSWPEDFPLHQANDVFTSDFGWTDTSTMIVVSDAAGLDGPVESLAQAVESDAAFAGTTVEWRGDVAFIDTHDNYALSDPESGDAIDRLRNEAIPGALDDTGATAYVGGSRAAQLDEAQLLVTYGPWAVAFILGATFLLLLVMFRSVVVPIKAIVMNVLSTAATFGVLVAVYQWGWGAAVGLPTIDGVSPYMPVMVFALVFGLSMDYHVFLLSRIRERYEATGDNRVAVIEGLTRTGPLITGAALIMIGVFGGFAIAPIPELSQWGMGLAAGVLIDATIIRVLLVPAAMMWLGKANWYLPSWLQWLPTVSHGAEAPAAAQLPDDDREPALV